MSATGGSMRYSFGDVDAHGLTLTAQAGALHAQHKAILADVTAAADFWGGAGSSAWTAFVEELGRNFAVIYENLETHGGKVRTAGNNTEVTDRGVGSSWGM